ncbi:MAG: hypothetical protein ABSE89_11210 [Sedimentisphaerales bacterium]
MYWLITLFAVMFVFAPVRKVFFATWRFFLPAIAGLIFALVMLKAVMKINLPGFMVLGISAYLAVQAGVIGMQYLNDIFGSNKPR